MAQSAACQTEPRQFSVFNAIACGASSPFAPACRRPCLWRAACGLLGQNRSHLSVLTGVLCGWALAPPPAIPYPPMTPWSVSWQCLSSGMWTGCDSGKAPTGSSPFRAPPRLLEESPPCLPLAQLLHYLEATPFCPLALCALHPAIDTHATLALPSAAAAALRIATPVIATCTHLRSLSLDDVAFSHMHDATAPYRLTAALSAPAPRLSSLSLRNTALPTAAAPPHLPQLATLDLGVNPFHSSFHLVAAALPAATALRVLRLDRTLADPPALRALAAALPKLQQLQSLAVSGRGLLEPRTPQQLLTPRKWGDPDLEAGCGSPCCMMEAAAAVLAVARALLHLTALTSLTISFRVSD
eukprot:jgi/Ulvmu1/10697/UM067_0023.1